MDKENFRSTSRWFGLAFIILAIILMIGSIRDSKEWNDVKRNGVSLQAEMVNIIDNIGVDEDWEVTFAYSYNGEGYQYIYRNYPSKRYVGKVVSAYIYPEEPTVLYPDGSIHMPHAWVLVGVAGIAVFLYGIWEFFPKKRSRKEKQAIKEKWDSL